jgi:Outer membrane protein beta-barrel domain
MKALIKISLMALLMMGYLQLLNAQIGLGVRGGVNIATSELEVKIADKWDTNWKDYMVGVNAGLVAEIGITDMFAFQPELNFIQKGYKADVTNGSTHTVTTTLNYLEAPLLMKGMFGPGDLKFNALLGPTFGYAFNGKVDSPEGKTDVDFGLVKRYDIGGLAGIGISYDTGNGILFMDGRMLWGFTNLDDSANSKNVNWHNRGFNFGIGYMYNLW